MGINMGLGARGEEVRVIKTGFVSIKFSEPVEYS
jgi:hypothetical protein